MKYLYKLPLSVVNYYTLAFLLATVTSFVACSSEKGIYSKVPFNRVSFIKNDTFFQFYTKPVDDKILPAFSDDKFYAWYKSDSILVTRGGYSGKLLQGDYLELYPDKAIKQKGKYVNGLKDGKWQTWFQNGEKESVTTWDNGFRNGVFEIYSAEGKLQKSGNYKSGKEDGEVSEFLQEGKVHKVLFKQGQVVSDTIINQSR